jgi:hypothetical protein
MGRRVGDKRHLLFSSNPHPNLKHILLYCYSPAGQIFGDIHMSHTSKASDERLITAESTQLAR